MYTIPISIATIQINVQSSVPVEKLKLLDQYRTFMNQLDKAQYHINLEWEEYKKPLHASPSLIFDPGEIWRMFRDESAHYATFDYRNANFPFHESNVLIINSGWNQLKLIERITGPDWISLLNIGAGELILRSAILFIQGLVFHASGIDDNGNGIVFVGHSGAGKSTQASIWQEEPGVIALNDDRIAIVPVNGEMRCFGTPWGGSLNIAKNHSAPLKAIVVLEQSSENAISPFTNPHLASSMMARAFLPYWDEALMILAMQNLESILAKVPVFLLKCRPEKAVIPLVRSVL